MEARASPVVIVEVPIISWGRHVSDNPSSMSSCGGSIVSTLVIAQQTRCLSIGFITRAKPDIPWCLNFMLVLVWHLHSAKVTWNMGEAASSFYWL